MNPVDFLGITFRSVEHFHWFIGTQTILITIACISILCVRIGWHRFAIELNKALAFGGFFIGFTAFFHYLDDGNGAVWSIDCAWYNPMLSCMYLFIAYLVKQQQYKTATV